MSKIKVGDTVMWRGGFGSFAPVPAVVESIEQTTERRSKYGGKQVTEAAWANKDYLLVDLANGHWAYGEQLSPMAVVA